MVATKQIYSALQLTGLMVQACDLQCPFPVEGVTCRTLETLEISAMGDEPDEKKNGMPFKGITSGDSIRKLADCVSLSTVESTIVFNIDPNFSDRRCKAWVIRFRHSPQQEPVISAYVCLWTDGLARTT
ncbi:unnamed protein product [Albugo candida]|uniref:Uncharacterized protein n=1 Tax=Albugo candida TaxID=65357 RepID=A0A024G8I0_9STRA|nr:unnamed protein product [Albugo candida]|eukprot:CCI42637.1 unnamed protein product [Albugo candida]